MNSYENMIARRDKLAAEITNLKNFIAKCPEGKLITRSNGSDTFRYYVKEKAEDGTSQERYLNQSQLPLATALAKKAYAIACLQDKEYEKKFLEQQLFDQRRDSKASKLLTSRPGIAKLVLPSLKSLDDYASKWQASDYVRSDLFPERLVVPTVVPGLLVRSKSESMILSLLINFGIPFRYEEDVRFGQIILHPDFTCMNPRTHEIFYWEHQGLVDDDNYVYKQRQREDLYRQAGIYPWKNLLITTETKDQPLDIRWAEEIIKHFLL